MPSTPIIAKLPEGLAGLKLELYPVGSDTLANTAGGDDLTEATNRKGFYTATVTEAITGDHYAVVKTSGGDKLADGWVLGLADTTAQQYLGDFQPELMRGTDGALTGLGANAPANWFNAASIATEAFTAAKFAANSLDGKGNWNIGKTGYSLTQDFPANFASLGINASGHVSRVTLVDTTTTNTDMRGTDSALLASNAPTNFSSLGINASGHISRVVLNDTTTTNTDMRGTDSANTTTPPTTAAIATAVLTTQMTESYAADGTAPTLAQAQFMCWSILAERSISGTTLTAKQLDGSTNAMTFTLDDATTPTSQTRAT